MLLTILENLWWIILIVFIIIFLLIIIIKAICFNSKKINIKVKDRQSDEQIIKDLGTLLKYKNPKQLPAIAAAIIAKPV